MTGKYGEKTIQSAGYRKVEVDRKEGDIWEEDGRKWTIKNGIDNKIKDFKNYVKDKLSQSNNQFISEAGHKETWRGKIDETRVEEHLSEVIEYLESLKE